MKEQKNDGSKAARPAPGHEKAYISAARKTVENWPQWKRDVYNRSFATASGAKKY